MSHPGFGSGGSMRALAYPTTPGNLLNSNDFDDFNALDSDWFLGVAGSIIRDYCGWHIFPVISQTGVHCQVGPQGIILLPTIQVVSVEQVVCRGAAVAAQNYTVHTPGWVQLHPLFVVNVGDIYPQVQWPGRHAYATVDFTHGYATMPSSVAEVGFELASRALEKPAGVAKELVAGPYRFGFNEFGPVLSEDQKRRLGPYTLMEFG